MGRTSFVKTLKEKFGKDLLKEDERIEIERRLREVQNLEERFLNGEISKDEYEELKSKYRL